jgi:hypothetical protein
VQWRRPVFPKLGAQQTFCGIWAPIETDNLNGTELQAWQLKSQHQCYTRKLFELPLWVLVLARVQTLM